MAQEVKARELESRDRWTGKVLGTVSIPERKDVEETVKRAKEAFAAWSCLSLEKRSEYLKRLLEEVVKAKHELSDLISKETGKPPFEALAMEVMPSLESGEFTVFQGPEILRREVIAHRRMKTYRSEVWYEPYGVVALITPWNFPFFLSFTPLVSALMAGNSVVLKPSEYTPLSVLYIQKLVERAGLPEDLVTVLPGGGEVGEWLIRSGVHKVYFTGSVPTGRKVASLCGELLIPVSLELGGKDPMIVLRDADIDRAAKGALWGSFANAGQICSSVERIFVDQEVYDLFLHALCEEAKKLRIPGKNRYETDLGPMNNTRQYEIVEEQVKDAVDKGAQVLFGGKGDGRIFQPTILKDVTEEMAIWREETFGPVVWVKAFSTEEEAIELANQSPYGLSASIWSEDSERAWELAKKLQFGFVYINDHLVGAGAGEVAWGGVKASGYGRTRGKEGLLQMVRTKYVAEDRAKPPHPVYWFPYTQEKYEQFLHLCDDLHSESWLRRCTGMLKLVWLLFRSER